MIVAIAMMRTTMRMRIAIIIVTKIIDVTVRTQATTAVRLLEDIFRESSRCSTGKIDDLL